MTSSPEEFAHFIKLEYEKWAKVIRRQTSRRNEASLHRPFREGCL